jgi:transposase-like protein
MLSLFKRRRFPVEIILLCVRWYCKYGISYRDLAEMMQERGIEVDPSTIFRWVQRYAPEIEKKVRWYQGSRCGSWRVDETYVRVGGKWRYLFRAVDKHGQLIDFMLSDRRNTQAAYRFLRKAVKTMSDYPPESITTDKLASYPKAIRRLQNEGLLPKEVMHRTSKYLNNIIEAVPSSYRRRTWLSSLRVWLRPNSRCQSPQPRPEEPSTGTAMIFGIDVGGTAEQVCDLVVNREKPLRLPC